MRSLVLSGSQVLLVVVWGFIGCEEVRYVFGVIFLKFIFYPVEWVFVSLVEVEDEILIMKRGFFIIGTSVMEVDCFSYEEVDYL